MKKVVVLSLGGSLIIPDKIDLIFLQKFKKIVKKHLKTRKFIIVCGGGSIARKYISALKADGKNTYFQSMAGIAATRTNARFMSYLFNQDPDKGIPHKKRDIKKYLKKQDIVFCGALEYNPKQTSDGTAASIAKYFKAEFINLTNVSGLYTDNPITNKKAKFIPEISWKEFYKIANKIKYKPGQHFVLDQDASKTIMNNKIKTYILGQNMKNLDNVLSNKKFKGTIISN